MRDFGGQDHIISYLQHGIRALGSDEVALGPQLFLGPPGLGKTLLAKVVANELRRRAEQSGLPPVNFLEVFPADVGDIPSLDAIMARVVARPGSVVFFDEIHDLTGAHARKLYLVLEEGRYLFHGDEHPTRLPPTTFIGATTDYGQLHAALQRRWERHYFEPATEEQLKAIVRRRPMPITEAAVALIVSRTKFAGAPWEAVQVYRMAATVAKGEGAPAIEVEHVEEVFRMQRIDELGLRWLDRRVIEALLSQPRHKADGTFVCYAASESNTCQLAQVDKAEYRESIRPRLMGRGLLEVRPTYGQALTGRAVGLYGGGPPAGVGGPARLPLSTR